MTFLPIVGRELRVAARRRGTFWSRFFTALGTIVIGLIVYSQSKGKPSHELGNDLFGVVSIIAFIYCLGTGIRSTADCLSEEKRDGTLGLLFLTDLKGYDVVGGKLVATSLNSFYGLMAIFPVLAIPLLLGGITNGEFWRMALVLANTFLFSLAVGMFMSSISTSPRKAMAGTLITILAVTIGFPILQNWVRYVERSPHLMTVFNFINPCMAFSLHSDMTYAKDAKNFWWSVGVIHGLCWLLLAAASFIVPRSWQDKPPGAELQRWRDRWHRWSYGDSEERHAFRKRLLDINAFFWLAGRARLKPTHVWVALMIVACLWTWGAVENGSEWMNGLVYVLTGIVLNTMLKIWVASESGRRLGEDRKIGALELLLSTPMTVSDILHGQILALKRQFLAPVVVVLLVEFIFLAATVQGNRAGPDELYPVVAFSLAFMVMLVADLLALSVLGMWVSLTARNPNRATGITLRRILVLPWAINIGVVLLASIVSVLTQLFEAASAWKLFLSLYCLTGLGTDLYFGLTAWRRLQAEFRNVAVQRFSAMPSFWSRLLGTKEPGAAETAPVTAPS